MIFRLIHTFRQRLKKSEAGNSLYQYAILMVLLIGVYAGVRNYMSADDKGVRESWSDTAWQVWQTMTTVGYGDKAPESLELRVLTIVCGTVGIALLGVCISGAFELKQYLSDRRRYGMMKNPFTDGYVVINFPGTENFRILVQEIRSIEKGVGICVIDGKLEGLPPSIAAEIPNLHFIKGNTLNRNICKMAAFDENKAVLIFPLDPSAPDSDGTTLAIISVVSTYAKGNARIIPMLVSPENEALFKDCNLLREDQSAVWQNLDILAIVQECQDQHSAEIIADLLANSKGANPNTVMPKRIVGWTWGDFVSKTVAVGNKTGAAVNPFAVVHASGDTESCPKTDYTIKADDCLSVIAHPGFDWEAFEEQLANVPAQA